MLTLSNFRGLGQVTTTVQFVAKDVATGALLEDVFVVLYSPEKLEVAFKTGVDGRYTVNVDSKGPFTYTAELEPKYPEIKGVALTPGYNVLQMKAVKVGVTPVAEGKIKPTPTPTVSTGSEVASAIQSVSKNIADVMKTRYSADIEKYRTEKAQAGVPQRSIYTGSFLPGPPSDIPWGTIAIVGGVAVAAIFILPKLMK